mmetsp:Transcript_11830/g.19262  ORF Transcript_11830/g.19262 Transcript_11830/m.19262 type:complete len:109 (+) Transcript_11830:494-820(+)
MLVVELEIDAVEAAWSNDAVNVVVAAYCIPHQYFQQGERVEEEPRGDILVVQVCSAVEVFDGTYKVEEGAVEGPVVADAGVVVNVVDTFLVAEDDVVVVAEDDFGLQI